jgi:hypothetical protein
MALDLVRIVLDGPDQGWVDKLLTDPTATFAAVLAVFTLALVIVGLWQGIQLRRSVTASKAAAEAALTQANAIMAAERPHLLWGGSVVHGLIGATQADRLYGKDAEWDLTAELKFTNQGKTPCRVGATAFVLVAGPLPSVPDYGESLSLQGVWVSAGGAYQAVATGRPKTLNETQRSAILHRQAPLFLIGRVEYTSVFGEEHLTRIAYAYRHGLAGAAPVWIAEDAEAYWEYS